MFKDFPNEFWPAMRYELWRYDPNDGLGAAYHYVNVTEAWAWFGIAGYVGWRMIRHRRHLPLELTYVALFVVFGISDLWESQVVPMWLIAAKGLIFAGIVSVRWPLVKWHYVGAKF